MSDEIVGSGDESINLNDLKAIEEKFRLLSRRIVSCALQIEAIISESAELMVALADAYKMAQVASDEKLANAILSMTDPSNMLEPNEEENNE